MAPVTTAQNSSDYVGASLPLDPRTAEVANRPYTVKAGDFRLLASPSITVEWNDNVGASGSGSGSDVVLRPMLQLNSSYPISANNLLRLDVGIGYDQYLDNDDLSTLRLQSNSALSFDLAIKDFTFNLHDRFSYVRDSAQQGDVAGSALQGNFNNTAGISALWNRGDLTLSGGYDHQNSFSTEDAQAYQDRSTELVHLRTGLRIHPQWMVGLEGNTSFTAYDQPVQNDNTGYSGGIYAQWETGTGLSIGPRVGYSYYDFRQTSLFQPATDADAWYADLTLRHQIRDAISYSLSAGRELRLGAQSDSVEAWYLRPSASWRMTDRISVSPSFSYEHGTQGASQYIGTDDETYDWIGGGLQATWSITSKLRMTLGYRITVRTSNVENRDYTQNLVSLTCSYSMQ